MAEPNSLTDWMGGNVGKWALPIGLGFLAGATPGTSRAAHGIATGLQMVGQAQDLQRQQAQRDELRKRLSSIFGQTQQVSTTEQLPQIETEPGDVPIGDRPVTTNQDVPMFSPQSQKLGEALLAANRPDLALSVAERAMSRQPHTFGSAETGYYTVNPDTGQSRQLIPGVGRREPTPPRPVHGTQGGEGVSSVYNPETRQWETTRQPLTAAPPRQLSPEQAEFTRAQTQNARSERNLREQRIENLRIAAKTLQDPNSSKEKLTTVRQGLLREKESVEKAYDYDSPENQARLADINTLLDDSRRRLAEIARLGAPQPQRQPGQRRPLGEIFSR